AQGLRIVNANKSKYYDAALSNFESAKSCFERAGERRGHSPKLRRAASPSQSKSVGIRGGVIVRSSRPPAWSEVVVWNRCLA
ncbi:MAG: hypothetical protein V2I67_09475, partial [Thermoanaerobaculales bacterium]|nr:hypothetical protein [Thermoanaerobaculales bacterium]